MKNFQLQIVHTAYQILSNAGALPLLTAKNKVVLQKKIVDLENIRKEIPGGEDPNSQEYIESIVELLNTDVDIELDSISYALLEKYDTGEKTFKEVSTLAFTMPDGTQGYMDINLAIQILLELELIK